MRKTIVLGIILALAFVFIPQVYAGPGLGVSDHETHAVVTNDQREFIVARLRNEGDIDLTITAEWKPNSATETAVFTVEFYCGTESKPATMMPITLSPQEDTLVWAKIIEASEPATYKGLVQFKGYVANSENSTGNPVGPSGSARASFTVETALSPPANSDVPLLIAAAVIAIASVSLVVWRLAIYPQKRKDKR